MERHDKPETTNTECSVSAIVLTEAETMQILFPKEHEFLNKLDQLKDISGIYLTKKEAKIVKQLMELKQYREQKHAKECEELEAEIATVKGAMDKMTKEVKNETKKCGVKRQHFEITVDEDSEDNIK